jgi:adenosylmethionine-8-amino-7-oxononanoate aminotransferase
MITVAKGLTNAAVPMGATFVSSRIYKEFMGASANTVVGWWLRLFSYLFRSR